MRNRCLRYMTKWQLEDLFPSTFFFSEISFGKKTPQLSHFISVENILKIEMTEHACDKGFTIEKEASLQKI